MIGFLKQLFPHTCYETYFNPKRGNKEYIHIYTVWLGKIIKEREFELARREEWFQYMKEMRKLGDVSEEDYQAALDWMRSRLAE